MNASATTAETTTAPLFGHARFDGSDRVEMSVPDSTGGAHAQANGPEAFVTDGGDEILWVLYYRWNEEAGDYDGPRKLVTLDWSLHPHRRLSPDGTWAQFNAAQDCSGNIYLAKIPEFEELPAYDTD